VFIAAETDQAAVLAKLRPGTRLRRFTARNVRDAGGVIRRAPEGGPGHCVVRFLRPEHREWMLQIRAHALSRKHDA